MKEYLENQIARFSYDYDEWEEGKTMENMFHAILAHENFANLKHITIANWNDPFDTGCQQIVDLLVEHKDQFQHIESFRFGEMNYEECELSWINQANYSRFWGAFPHLKNLAIQGSFDIDLGSIVSDSLENLEIMCSGLTQDMIHAVARAKAPNLLRFCLFIGVDNYGYNCTPEDLDELLNGSNFPELIYLGLCDSENTQEILEAVLKSKYLPQITTLDLSMSVFTDACGELVLQNADKLSHLNLLNLEYHFLTDDMMKKLSELPFEVNLKDQQEFEEYDGEIYASPMYTE